MSNYVQKQFSISHIIELFNKKTLIIDPSYQRRSIWSEKDRVALIETILLDLVIPELFFWQAEINPKTGTIITHIVDGQQRIRAIVQFILGEYSLQAQFLREKPPNPNWVDRKFMELSEDDMKKIWSYNLSVIDIDSNVKRDEVINMFQRLNLTDYNLNDQEKRNTNSGEFAVLVKELAVDPFWRIDEEDSKKQKDSLFNVKEVNRMKNREFCATIILLWRYGIGETPQKVLNDAYDELGTNYQDAEKDKGAVLKAMEEINKFIDKETIRFLQKKAQLYTLFSFVFYTFREKKDITAQQLENFHQFVKLYSKFKTDFKFPESATEEEKYLHGLLSKYKQASSEGLNKHTNRMIRFNMLKSFLYELTPPQILAQQSLLEKLEGR